MWLSALRADANNRAPAAFISSVAIAERIHASLGLQPGVLSRDRRTSTTGLTGEV